MKKKAVQAAQSPEEILRELRFYSNPQSRIGMARFGINTKNALGVSMPVLRKIAKRIGKDHTLAGELWNSGIHEARILASIIDDPVEVTVRQMQHWSAGFDSWDICDQCCMNLFSKTPLAWKQAPRWMKRKSEFEKRAAFALIACLAWYEGPEKDEMVEEYIPLIVQNADDPRTYVKKAVSWALRNIGKRSRALRRKVLTAMRGLKKNQSVTVRWIVSDVVRELESNAVRTRVSKREKTRHQRTTKKQFKRKTPYTIY